MSEPAPLLGREGIEEAFRRLGDRLARRGVVADIYVFGGAAMALAYDSRRATRDVDALFKPHGIVLEEAHAVAAELGLPTWGHFPSERLNGSPLTGLPWRATQSEADEAPRCGSGSHHGDLNPGVWERRAPR
jgi:hypothetical protein